MTDSSNAISYHEFIPDNNDPQHCSVCWQYKIWWMHTSPESKPADSSNELIRLQGEVERLKGELWNVRFIQYGGSTVPDLTAQVETLTQEREHFRQQTRAIDDEYEEERKLTSELKQQLTEALRINSALRDAIQDARANLFIGSDEYIKANVGHILAAALTQSAEVPSPWISVKDRLPGDNVPVIVYGGIAVHYSERPYGREGWWSRMECPEAPIQWEVSHWMPMPEPPSPISAAQEEQL